MPAFYSWDLALMKLTLVLLAKVHLQFKGTGSRDFIPLFLGEIILFQRSKCACPRCQRLHRQRVCGVNDYADTQCLHTVQTFICPFHHLFFFPLIKPILRLHVANCYLDILFPRSEQLRGQTIFANFFVNSKVLWSQFASSYWSKKGKKSLDQ